MSPPSRKRNREIHGVKSLETPLVWEIHHKGHKRDHKGHKGAEWRLTSSFSLWSFCDLCDPFCDLCGESFHSFQMTSFRIWNLGAPKLIRSPCLIRAALR